MSQAGLVYICPQLAAKPLCCRHPYEHPSSGLAALGCVGTHLAQWAVPEATAQEAAQMCNVAWRQCAREGADGVTNKSGTWNPDLKPEQTTRC